VDLKTTYDHALFAHSLNYEIRVAEACSLFTTAFYSMDDGKFHHYIIIMEALKAKLT
jgi:hypothetical protein